MKMEVDLMLNQIDSKFFVKMIGAQRFRNPKNGSQDWIKGFIKNQKIRIKIKIEATKNPCQKPHAHT